MVDVYASEQEQVEALKKWIKDNGMALIVGAAIGLGGLFGWQYWQRYQDERGEAASARYESVFRAAQTQQYDLALEDGKAVIAEYQDTPYAVLTALVLAKVEVERDQPEAAQGHLRWALEHAGSDETRHVARLRLARLLLDGGDASAAKSLVDGVTHGSFAAAYQELLGDLAVASGDSDRAREHYAEALARGPAVAAIIQLKLDDLGHMPGPGASN